ncbi:MAG TPA: pyridoxamine 5'-phosphate oxidase family protein [Micromonosporaceae bacterium]|nr:pyridoxamine 5'-phosphate oxidase family protein [Micromonosporaceae bacterium]
MPEWRPPPEYLEFLTVPRIASMALALRDGRIHQTPVKMALDIGSGLAVVLTSSKSVKARRIRGAGGLARVALGEHSSTLWVTLEGPATVVADSERVEWARDVYARRFGRRSTWGDCVVQVCVENVLYGT